jgi:hypothetical protein
MNRLAVIAQEPVLSVPTGFKGEVTNKGIQLTWDEVDPEWVPGFNLYLADEDGNPGRKLNREPLTENQITLAKLKHNKTYGFFLTGISKDGQEGPPTAVLTIQYPDLLKK